MRSPEQIAERIATPEGLEPRHVLEAARLVVAEGLLPRDGTVLSRARQLAAAETPEARETWAAVLAAMSERGVSASAIEVWLSGIHPTADGDRLVLMCPRRQAAWIAARYSGLIRGLVEELDTEERWQGMAFRPYGPERTPA